MTLVRGKTLRTSPGSLTSGSSTMNDLGLFPGSSSVTPLPRSGYLANPGMGFQGVNEFDSPFEQTVLYRRGITDGYTWSQMNPSSGVFDWSKIDADLALVASLGWQLSFRVYTMRGESFGGHYVPQWVVDAGAIILSGIEPDYRSRVYQQKWGLFVDAMRARYDGNPLIAFIDIAGYGEFNQWFSSTTAPYYPFQQDVADPWNPTTPDSHTRKHLVAMFAGGSGTCSALEADGTTQAAFGYAYPGFQSTQLLMPYNGLFQPTQMVLDHYPNVGLRNDFLGTQQLSSFVNMGHGATTRWRTAPVVFETGPVPHDYTIMGNLLPGIGASIIEDRNNFRGDPEFPATIAAIGYRYVCDTAQHAATHPRSAGPLKVVSTWRNTGYAKAYPRTGQDFRLEWSFATAAGAIQKTIRTGENVSAWMPRISQPCYSLLPVHDLPAGSYTLLAGIVDLRTEELIHLGCSNGTVRDDRRLHVADVELT